MTQECGGEGKALGWLALSGQKVQARESVKCNAEVGVLVCVSWDAQASAPRCLSTPPSMIKSVI